MERLLARLCRMVLCGLLLPADTYIHAVELEGEYIFEDNYFSLLPGEVRTVYFRPAENAQSNAFTVTGYTVKT